MQKWYQSKKFWAMAGSIITVLGTAVTGEVAWPQAIGGIITIVAFYLTGQSVVDAADKFAKK